MAQGRVGPVSPHPLPQVAGDWTFLPRTGQWTVAWGRARDSGPARRPRDQDHRELCRPGRGAGSASSGRSGTPAGAQPNWMDGHPGASLTLAPGYLPAPFKGAWSRFVATLGRMTHERLICSLGGLKPAFCKLRTHQKTSNLQPPAATRYRGWCTDSRERLPMSVPPAVAGGETQDALGGLPRIHHTYLSRY